MVLGKQSSTAVISASSHTQQQANKKRMSNRNSSANVNSTIEPKALLQDLLDDSNNHQHSPGSAQLNPNDIDIFTDEENRQSG
jgi:hypothetical protein